MKDITDPKKLGGSVSQTTIFEADELLIKRMKNRGITALVIINDGGSEDTVSNILRWLNLHTMAREFEDHFYNRYAILSLKTGRDSIDPKTIFREVTEHNEKTEEEGHVRMMLFIEGELVDSY